MDPKHNKGARKMVTLFCIHLLLARVGAHMLASGEEVEIQIAAPMNVPATRVYGSVPLSSPVIMLATPHS